MQSPVPDERKTVSGTPTPMTILDESLRQLLGVGPLVRGAVGREPFRAEQTAALDEGQQIDGNRRDTHDVELPGQAWPRPSWIALR